MKNQLPLTKSILINRKQLLSSNPYVWRSPGDKSISQRVTFLASIAEGKSYIKGILWSEDIINNLIALQQLGIQINQCSSDIIEIYGRGLNGYENSNTHINLGNSATSSRLLIALLSGQSGTFIVNGNNILKNRPMQWIVDPLKSMGANLDYLEEEGCLPILINGAQLSGIDYYPQVSSAQATSTIMFASLLANSTTIIHKKVLARDHTERLFKYFGLNLYLENNLIQIKPPQNILPQNIDIPGDISSAAFIIAFVVMFPFSGLTLTIQNVGLNPTRMGFIKVLIDMGANIKLSSIFDICNEPRGNITIVSGNKLKGITISDDNLIQSMIDEIPLLSAIAAIADGKTEITNALELRDKDSDRILTTLSLLQAFGIESFANPTGLTIYKSAIISPKYFPPTKDHRITMTAVILAGILPEKTQIDGLEVIRVSFPGFVEVIERFAEVQVV